MFSIGASLRRHYPDQVHGSKTEGLPLSLAEPGSPSGMYLSVKYKVGGRRCQEKRLRFGLPRPFDLPFGPGIGSARYSCSGFPTMDGTRVVSNMSNSARIL